jgi:hypothetical protein
LPGNYKGKKLYRIQQIPEKLRARLNYAGSGFYLQRQARLSERVLRHPDENVALDNNLFDPQQQVTLKRSYFRKNQ